MSEKTRKTSGKNTEDECGSNLMLKKTNQGTLGTKEALKLEDKAYLMRLGPQSYVDLKHHPTAVARCVCVCVICRS
jgi:hypothetical protein